MTATTKVGRWACHRSVMAPMDAGWWPYDSAYEGGSVGLSQGLRRGAVAPTDAAWRVRDSWSVLLQDLRRRAGRRGSARKDLAESLYRGGRSVGLCLRQARD